MGERYTISGNHALCLVWDKGGRKPVQMGGDEIAARLNSQADLLAEAVGLLRQSEPILGDYDLNRRVAFELSLKIDAFLARVEKEASHD